MREVKLSWDFEYCELHLCVSKVDLRVSTQSNNFLAAVRNVFKKAKGNYSSDTKV